MVEVSFYGVRGSCPCACERNRRYGGNTACVGVSVPGQSPIILDLGTGLCLLGEDEPGEATFTATAFVTHLHWDHVQGLPFFAPINRTGASLEVYGPVQEGGTMAEMFDGLMRPPYFPIHLSDLRGRIDFHDLSRGEVEVGEARVVVRPVPHPGPTVGYRIEWQGVTVTYISDHQAPLGLDSIADEVLELAENADLLIHDAQYTYEEFLQKPDWGHGPVGYAVAVAEAAGARRLALFHHDPAHGDDEIDSMLAEARRACRRDDLLITAAAEGDTVILEAAGSVSGPGRYESRELRPR